MFSSMKTTTKSATVTWRRARESGTALYKWRRLVGINRVTFARLANFSERTLATYEKKPTFPAPIRPQVNEAVRLVQALLEIIPADKLKPWLHTANPGFGGRKPWTLIQNGERDIIWQMIHQTRTGTFA
jgi:DNA-binding transcriptional regulator YiaG